MVAIAGSIETNAEVATAGVLEKKAILKYFAKFTGKHLCPISFLNKVAGATYNFIKKGSVTGVFL